MPLFSEVPEGTLALIVEHKIRYVRTLEYRNVPALVQLWIGAVKGASFDIHYLVQDPVTREDCVRATSHLAFVDEATGRVLRLTPEQKEKLARFTPVHARYPYQRLSQTRSHSLYLGPPIVPRMNNPRAVSPEAKEHRSW